MKIPPFPFIALAILFITSHSGRMKQIFIVEDHESIREGVAAYLELSGYTVSKFALIQEAKSALTHTVPDLLVQDVMMPDGDGFAFVKQLRGSHEFPVIFVTARGSESDRIMGFELGCDDYIVKPFSPKELVLRVDAIIRRSCQEKEKKESKESIWTLEGSSLRVDENMHVLLLDEREIDLTAAEWRIFTHLIHNAGSVVSRSQVLETCFQYSFESYDRIVDTHVKNIRAKLGESGLRWIETVRGYGYRFSGKGC